MADNFENALFEKMANERERLLEDLEAETVVKDLDIKEWSYYFELYRLATELGIINDFYRYLRERKGDKRK